MDTSNRPLLRNIEIHLSRIMQILILWYTIWSISIHDYIWAAASLCCFLLSVTPMLIKHRFNVALPTEVNLLVISSLFFHTIGMVRELYVRVPIWDKIGHFASSAVVAIIAFLAVFTLDYLDESIKINRPLSMVLIVMFTVAAGAIWEMGEFLSDTYFGTTTQHGLTDTMHDMILDTLGGMMMAVIGDIYLRYVPRKRIIEAIVNFD